MADNPVAYTETLTRVCSPRGTVAHLRRGRDLVCPKTEGRDWVGTGSQEEYEHAASLPLCRKCEASVTSRGLAGANGEGAANGAVQG